MTLATNAVAPLPASDFMMRGRSEQPEQADEWAELTHQLWENSSRVAQMLRDGNPNTETKLIGNLWRRQARGLLDEIDEALTYDMRNDPKLTVPMPPHIIPAAEHSHAIVPLAGHIGDAELDVIEDPTMPGEFYRTFDLNRVPVGGYIWRICQPGDRSTTDHMVVLLAVRCSMGTRPWKVKVMRRFEKPRSKEQMAS